ncbi:MAG: tetratricopeptide repeat protein [Chloroflexota bacterium]
MAEFRAILALPGAADLSQLRGDLLTLAGETAHDLADYAVARALQEESVAVLRGVGNRRRTAYALSHLGLTLREQGDYPAARAALEECLALCRQLDIKVGVANSLERLGTVAQAAGDYAAAEAYYEESLVAAKAMGDDDTGWTVLNMACLALDRGDPAAARPRLREVLQAMPASEDMQFVMYVLAAAASLAVAEGAHDGASRLAGAVDALEMRSGAPLQPTYRARFGRSLTLAGAALGEAGVATARAAGHALTPEQAVAEALDACRA